MMMMSIGGVPVKHQQLTRTHPQDNPIDDDDDNQATCTFYDCIKTIRLGLVSLVFCIITATIFGIMFFLTD